MGNALKQLSQIFEQIFATRKCESDYGTVYPLFIGASEMIFTFVVVVITLIFKNMFKYGSHAFFIFGL